MTQFLHGVKWTNRGIVHSAGGVPIGELAHYLLHSFSHSFIIKTVKAIPLMTFTKTNLNQNTFKPYAVLYRTGGQVEKFHFLTGWGASVANHSGSYGGDDGLYELAEINPNGHIIDDSIKGWLTFAEVECYLREIAEY